MIEASREDAGFRIAVIGLGYVGLPLAVELSTKFPVIGFDISHARLSELAKGVDVTQEVEGSRLRSDGLRFSGDIEDCKLCNVFIVTVPTPVDCYNVPDLHHLKSASELVAGVLKEGDVVVYESTVFPGCTEQICVPILENSSGLRLNESFSVGYSPERINPGDSEKGLTQITKVVSASNDMAVARLVEIYGAVIDAGVYIAKSIVVAESAKVIENVQRDINIGLVNELAQLFSKMDISIYDVLSAAKTKWNFLAFEPGLVGGHCIGVDPYYLTYKAAGLGYHPQIIQAGRLVNDFMHDFIARKLSALIGNSKREGALYDFLLLGLTFKENCPDTRNSRCFHLWDTLISKGFSVKGYDPYVDGCDYRDSSRVYCPRLPVDLSESPKVVVLLVPHELLIENFLENWSEFINAGGIVFDLKNRLLAHPSILSL